MRNGLLPLVNPGTLVDETYVEYVKETSGQRARLNDWIRRDNRKADARRQVPR